MLCLFTLTVQFGCGVATLIAVTASSIKSSGGALQAVLTSSKSSRLHRLDSRDDDSQDFQCLDFTS